MLIIVLIHSNHIIHLYLQSNEAGNSNACELIGFKRCMSYLTETESLTIKSLVTDRHKQINAFIRDDLKFNIEKCRYMEHYYDVWHAAKGNFIPHTDTSIRKFGTTVLS